METYNDVEDDVVSTPIRNIPKYGSRRNFVPTVDADFADGGAYPEIHLLQYPLGMGRKDDKTEQHLTVQVDRDGNLNYDQILKQGAGKKKIFTKT